MAAQSVPPTVYVGGRGDARPPPVPTEHHRIESRPLCVFCGVAFHLGPGGKPTDMQRSRGQYRPRCLPGPDSGDLLETLRVFHTSDVFLVRLTDAPTPVPDGGCPPLLLAACYYVRCTVCSFHTSTTGAGRCLQHQTSCAVLLDAEADNQVEHPATGRGDAS